MRQVLDARMKEVSKTGLGSLHRRADIISPEQESILWGKDLLGSNTPTKMLDTLVFSFGLNFALSAGQEHRNLHRGPMSQLQIKTDQDGTQYLLYTEDVSKTNSGGLNSRKVDPKIVRVYEDEECPEKCVVKLYKKYVSLYPKSGKTDALYLRPKKFPTESVWFDDIPVGIHPLQGTVARLCKAAGITGYFTNHSLRATAATRLYSAGIDEQLISEKTGHRSLALRGFKRTSDEQLKTVDSILK